MAAGPRSRLRRILAATLDNPIVFSKGRRAISAPFLRSIQFLPARVVIRMSPGSSFRILLPRCCPDF